MKIIFSCLLRDNEKYIPYLFKCIEQNEKFNKGLYNFEYLFYTNDNNDKTLELLEAYSIENKNIIIINESLNDDLLKMDKVERLYHIREKVLGYLRERNFDYSISLDTDIFFNGLIVREVIQRFENNNYDALFTNTVSDNQPFHYDLFALIENKKFKQAIIKDNFRAIYFQLKLFFTSDIIPVESGFAGFLITNQDVIKNKSNNYLQDKIDITVCEHIKFLSTINVGMIPDINPLRCQEENNFDFTMKIIEKNKILNRWSNGSITFILSYVLIVIFIIIVLVIVYKKCMNQV